MTKIFAHRGASQEYPENTMLAFEAAYEVGTDGIELDVQLTKDGVAVVIHDEMLDRTTNATGWLCDYTFEELQDVDAAYKFNKFFGRSSIPTLESVLKWAKAKDRPFLLNIELKNSVVNDPLLEKKVIDLIKKYEMEPFVILSSFNHYSLMKIERMNTGVETAILYSEWLYEPWNYSKQLGIKSLHPHYRSLQEDFIVKKAKQSGVLIRPYTVNKEKDIKRFIQLGVDAIITDYPQKAIKIRNRLKR